MKSGALLAFAERQRLNQPREWSQFMRDGFLTRSRWRTEAGASYRIIAPIMPRTTCSAAFSCWNIFPIVLPKSNRTFGFCGSQPTIQTAR